MISFLIISICEVIHKLPHIDFSQLKNGESEEFIVLASRAYHLSLALLLAISICLTQSNESPQSSLSSILPEKCSQY